MSKLLILVTENIAIHQAWAWWPTYSNEAFAVAVPWHDALLLLHTCRRLLCTSQQK